MLNYTLKFVLVGDSNVGKSQLARSFTKKSFNNNAQSTVGMEFCTRSIEFERCVIKSNIWDTAGQERFEGMTKVYYRDSVGAIVVFDVCNKESFARIRTVWLKQLQDVCHEGIQIILVGNKIDLVESNQKEREVSREEAIAFAEEENVDYIETSALTGYGVEICLRRIVLSVAKLLPDVMVHLDIAGLPEGWLLIESADPEQSEGDAVDETSSNLKPNRRQSWHNMHTTPLVVKQNKENVTNTIIISTIGGTNQSHGSGVSPNSRRKSLQQTKLNPDGSMNNDPVTLHGELGRFSNLHRSYMNYWTGEIFPDYPTAAANPNLLHKKSYAKSIVNTVDVPRNSNCEQTERSSSARTGNISITLDGQDDESIKKRLRAKKCRCIIL